jgi:hypothetical protein
MSSGSPTSSADPQRHATEEHGSPSWTDVRAATIRALVEFQEQTQRSHDGHTSLSAADVHLLTRLYAQLDEVALPEQLPDDIPPEVDEAAMTLLLAAIARLQADNDDLLKMSWQIKRYRTPSEAAWGGFGRGLIDSVSWDFFGDDDFLQARHLIAHREDALRRDWSRVADDCRNALARIYEQLHQELRELNERQGTLFSPNDLERSVERH